MSPFQKAIIYLKEINEIGLYASLSQTRWFMFLRNTSLYFITFPFLSLLMIVDALINLHIFYKSKNKNIDKWMLLIGSITSAAFGSTALVGTVLASTKGILFFAGPFLFIASLAALIIQQSVLLTLNLMRYREAKHSSLQQFNYAKKIINNLFSLALLSAALGAAVLIFVFPGLLPVMGTICAVLTLSLIAVNIGWRVIPYHWKNTLQKPLKIILGMQDKIADPLIKSEKYNPLPYSTRMYSKRLFSAPDFISPMLLLNGEQRINFLSNLINNKISRLINAKDCSKIHQKVNLLYDLSRKLDRSRKLNVTVPVSKSELSVKYPQAFKSFFADIGEVEAIVDAIGFHQIELNSTNNRINNTVR